MYANLQDVDTYKYYFKEYAEINKNNDMLYDLSHDLTYKNIKNFERLKIFLYRIPKFNEEFINYLSILFFKYDIIEILFKLIKNNEDFFKNNEDRFLNTINKLLYVSAIDSSLLIYGHGIHDTSFFVVPENIKICFRVDKDLSHRTYGDFNNNILNFYKDFFGDTINTTKFKLYDSNSICPNLSIDFNNSYIDKSFRFSGLIDLDKMSNILKTIKNFKIDKQYMKHIDIGKSEKNISKMLTEYHNDNEMKIDIILDDYESCDKESSSKVMSKILTKNKNICNNIVKKILIDKNYSSILTIDCINDNCRVFFNILNDDKRPIINKSKYLLSEIVKLINEKFNDHIKKPCIIYIDSCRVCSEGQNEEINKCITRLHDDAYYGQLQKTTSELNLQEKTEILQEKQLQSHKLIRQTSYSGLSVSKLLDVNNLDINFIRKLLRENLENDKHFDFDIRKFYEKITTSTFLILEYEEFCNILIVLKYSGYTINRYEY